MSNIDVILLPEVVDLVCDSLHPQEVAFCRSVCRQWRNCFTPFIPSLNLVLPFMGSEIPPGGPLTPLCGNHGDTKVPPKCTLPSDMSNAVPSWTLHMDDHRLSMHQALLVDRGVDPWGPLLRQLQTRGRRAGIRSMRLCFHPSLILQFSDDKEHKVRQLVSHG